MLKRDELDEAINGLDIVIGDAEPRARRYTYFVWTQWLIDLEMSADDRAHANQRIAEIAAKHGVDITIPKSHITS